MKHLNFISNRMSSSDWCNRESVATGVEWLFIDGFSPETRFGDRLNNGYTEISRNFGYAHQSLLTLQPEQRNGLFLGCEVFALKQQQKYRFKSAVLI